MTHVLELQGSRKFGSQLILYLKCFTILQGKKAYILPRKQINLWFNFFP